MGKRKINRARLPGDMSRVDQIDLILQLAGHSLHAADIQAAMKTRSRITHELGILVAQGKVIHLGMDNTAKVRYIHTSVANTLQKRACLHCGVEKPLTKEFFHVKEKATHTFHGTCKVCRLKILRARREKAAEQRTSERSAPPGRIEETNTEGGRVVRFGRHWKATPSRPIGAKAMLGYCSPLNNL